jgi:hypothetical protein
MSRSFDAALSAQAKPAIPGLRRQSGMKVAIVERELFGHLRQLRLHAHQNPGANSGNKIGRSVAGAAAIYRPTRYALRRNRRSLTCSNGSKACNT